MVVLTEVAHAVPMACAPLAGGIRMLEVTLCTSQALACIEAIARELPESVVGAGTVGSGADAQAATRAGARFAVSPGYMPAVGQTCRDAGLALLPGVATGSEIMQTQEDGFTEIKFFPAMPKARRGPFFDVKFCPACGLTLQNAPEFLALPNVVCVGGSWLVPAEPLAGGDWTRITPLAADARALARIT